MQPAEMKSGSEIIDEVANVLERLCLKHPNVFDELQIRYPLCDELGGFASMLRDHAKAMEMQADTQATAVIEKASGMRP